MDELTVFSVKRNDGMLFPVTFNKSNNKFEIMNSMNFEFEFNITNIKEGLVLCDFNPKAIMIAIECLLKNYSESFANPAIYNLIKLMRDNDVSISEYDMAYSQVSKEFDGIILDLVRMRDLLTGLDLTTEKDYKKSYTKKVRKALGFTF